MPKPANLIPSRQLNVALPLPIFTQLTLHLHSELEGRVPHGAYSRFVGELLRQHFARRELDLAPFLNQPDLPGGVYVVQGDPVTMEILERRLS